MKLKSLEIKNLRCFETYKMANKFVDYPDYAKQRAIARDIPD